MRRMALLVLLVVPLFLATSNIGNAAASWHSYHNARFGYTVSYPPDWQRASAGFTSALGADFLVNTSDQDATFFAITPTPVSANMGQQPAYVYYELTNLGVSRGAKIHFSVRTIHGITYTQGSAQVIQGTGRGTVTVLLTYRKKLAYIFATTLLTDVSGKPRRNAAAQQNALNGIIATITLH